MKYICLTIAGILLTSLSYAQGVVVDSPEYQELKESGNLGIVLPGPPATVTPGTSWGMGNGGTVTPLAGCDCYIEPDATWSTLQACDDCSSGLINLPFQFCFFGQTANSFYINNNGSISFNSAVPTPFSPPPLPSAGQAVLGAYWADVDTRSNLGQVRYKITPTAAYINWVNVGYYNTQGNMRNTFSLVITNGNDPSIGIGNNVAYCYRDMQWTTGSASGGQGGFGGTPATVGANWGVNNQFIRIGTFNAPGVTYNGPDIVSQVSWLDNKSFKFNVCNSVNAPPILISGTFPGYVFRGDSCNAINGGTMVPVAGSNGICVGQTVTGTLSFTGPENNQSVTVVATGPPGLSTTGGTGTTANLNITYTPTQGTSGPQTITITATDNGNPVRSTVMTLVVNVTSPPYYPTIGGPDNVCPGNPVNLTVNEVFDTYRWSGAATGTTRNISGPTGTYNVTTTIGPCTLSVSKTVGLFVPPVPVISGNAQVCAGQTTTLSTTQPFTAYQWSTGDLTPVSQAGAGSHTVQVTDGNGCQGTSAPFVVTEYTRPLIQTDAVNVTCNRVSDGRLTVLLGTPTGTETIRWDHDAAVTSFTATGLAAGIYTFTVTDANGCTWPGSGTVTEPPVLQMTLATTNVTCPGGSDGAASATVTGGTLPYLYSWNTGASDSYAAVQGLAQGTYPVTVTDANGCSVSQTFTLTEISTTPTITSTSAIESCPGGADGSIDLTVTGGNPYFSFLWSNSDTNEDPQDLGNGTYQVTVTDMNGCTFTHSEYVGVGENLTINTAVTDVLCFGKHTGSIVIQPVTGIAPFSISMNGAPAGLNNQSLPAGNYSFYLTDVNGCHADFNATIDQPTLLKVDSTRADINLGDVLDLEILASGGVPPYTYQWLPPQYLSCVDCTSPTTYAVNTTSYSVVVTDSHGCVSYGEAYVEVRPSPTFAPASFSPNGDGLNDVFLVSIAGVKDFEMNIYDRWGERVFHSDNIYEGWDGKVNGKVAESGVFVYKIFTRFINGKQEQMHGSIMLLR